MKLDVENGKPVIEFAETEIKEILCKCQDIINSKKSEEHYKIDALSMAKRQLTGKMGEAAVGFWLGKDIVDWSVGNSKEYNVPDLQLIGIKLGIKCVNAPAAHIVLKTPTYGEILCIRTENKITILGIATINILKKYSSDALVNDQNLIKRNVKTGFNAYDKLLPPELFNIGRFAKTA